MNKTSLVWPGLLVLVALIAWSGRPDAIVGKQAVPASAAAQKNELLALGRLAAHTGARVEMLAELPDDRLPPAGATLWLPVPANMLGPAQTRGLLAWVREGGHLVIAPAHMEHWENDALLAAAGMHFAQVGDAAMAEVFSEQAPRRPYAGFPYAGTDGTTALQATLDLSRAVVATASGAEAMLCDPGACRAGRVAFGRGRITAVADNTPFRNTTLGDDDQGAVALQLLDLQPGTTFWLVYEERVPDLFRLLWRHAAAALLLAAAATALWAWRAGMRFGPALASPQPPRRRLGEHVEAAGLLLARHAGHQHLWQACREDFLRFLYRRHPLARDGDEQALAILIARHTGLDAESVRSTLAGPADDNAESFAHAVRQLELLRRML